MSEARAITNLIGNGVATMVVAKWEGGLDIERVRAVLASNTDALEDKIDDVTTDGVAASEGMDAH
jgi:Na+/H+-dicarboxylate symporter